MHRISMHQLRVGTWLAGLALATMSVFAQAAEPVRIGWVNWADAEIAAKLAKVVLEKEANQEVKLQQAAITIQFEALSAGKIDVVPMVWLPTSHGELWKKYKDKVDDLGVEYQGKVGIAVPALVSEDIKSITDLAKPGMKEKFGGVLLTSEVGNGQYKLGQQAIKEYGLDGWKLVASSETGMITEADRRTKRGEWSAVNAWSPHWMFAKLTGLRYLDDPKNIYGGPEDIHVVARKGFAEQNPQVANFFRHYKLKQDDLQNMMDEAREKGVDAVVEAYYQKNKAEFAAMLK